MGKTHVKGSVASFLIANRNACPIYDLYNAAVFQAMAEIHEDGDALAQAMKGITSAAQIFQKFITTLEDEHDPLERDRLIEELYIKILRICKINRLMRAPFHPLNMRYDGIEERNGGFHALYEGIRGHDDLKRNGSLVHHGLCMRQWAFKSGDFDLPREMDEYLRETASFDKDYADSVQRVLVTLISDLERYGNSLPGDVLNPFRRLQETARKILTRTP